MKTLQQILNDKKIVRQLVPELDDLKNVIENNPWHNNESTFTHTLIVVKELEMLVKKENLIKFFKHEQAVNKINAYLNYKIEKNKRKDLLILAAYLHDLGKRETYKVEQDISSFPKHEKVSAVKAKKILKRFNLSEIEEREILNIIKNHSLIHALINPEDSSLEKKFQKLKNKWPEFFTGLILLVLADTKLAYIKKTKPENYKFRINFYKKILLI